MAIITGTNTTANNLSMQAVNAGGPVRTLAPGSFKQYLPQPEYFELNNTLQALIANGSIAGYAVESPVYDSGPVAAADAASFLQEAAGVIPSARELFSANPTNGQTVTVGAHVFQFVTALGAVQANTQIKVAGSAAAALALLVAAINGTVDVANITYGTAAFEKVVADAVDATHMRLRYAQKRGGVPAVADKAGISIALATTNGTNVWDQTVLQNEGRAANAPSACGSVAITAAMITAAAVYMEFPFTIVDFTVQFKSAAGLVLDGICTDLVTATGKVVKIALAGGGAPALIATNVVTVEVFG